MSRDFSCHGSDKNITNHDANFPSDVSYWALSDSSNLNPQIPCFSTVQYQAPVYLYSKATEDFSGKVLPKHMNDLEIEQGICRQYPHFQFSGKLLLIYKNPELFRLFMGPITYYLSRERIFLPGFLDT